MYPDPIITPDTDKPAIGSRWYAFGRQVEVVDVFHPHGELHVRERDVRTKAKLIPTPLVLWQRRAVPVR